MDQLQKKQLRELILKKIEISKRKIGTYEEMTAPITPENSIGRISRMDAINNKSVAESALREEEQKMKGLEYMLANIDNEEFGRCIMCDYEIPIPRLLLMPHSPYCVSCAD